MADLRITIGTVVDEKISVPNARAQTELAAFARRLGAGTTDTPAQMAQRILRHLGGIIRDGAYQQLEREAQIAAQQQFEQSTPRPGDWA